MKKFLTILLLVSATTVAFLPAQAENLKVEAGMGLQFGGIGANANFDVGNRVELFAGLGLAPGQEEVYGDEEYAFDLGYSLGAKYYVTNHIRLTGGYGTVGTINTKDSEWSDDIDVETVKGKFIGLGYYTSRHKGFVADVFIVENKDNFYDKIQDLEQNDGKWLETVNDQQVKLSVGYRF
ncbi:MAG: hypothetical protein L3J59_16350 [Methylococcaceae bacterium]|nr:hypothetical protein [Methylococcaceae bacterium]